MKLAVVLTLVLAAASATSALAQPELIPQDAGYVSTLKSVGAEYGAAIDFRNEAQFNVEILWIDYSGEFVSFGILSPGEEMRQGTFVGHPWLVRESTNSMLLVGFIAESVCSFLGCTAVIDGTLVPVEPATWSSVKAWNRQPAEP